jgi:hypothetical protein
MEVRERLRAGQAQVVLHSVMYGSATAEITPYDRDMTG